MSDLHSTCIFLVYACLYVLKYLKQTWRHIIFISGLLGPVVLYAQKTDTLATVQVNAAKVIENTVSLRPIQHIDKKSLETLNTVSVADATKFFSGVLLKDYGGLGGLKTISIRSLGTGYTAVMYDGVLLSDVQAGQIDLGKISTANIDNITLYNGQPLAQLLPAKAYAAGALLDMQTTGDGISSQKKGWMGNTMLKAGSFGFINPSATVRFQNKNLLQVWSAEWQSSEGNYPFKAYEADSTDRKRTNGDIKSLRLEYDIRYQWGNANKIQLKAYHYNSDRGLPGAVILYTTGGKERLSDNNSFAQAIYKKSFSAKSKLMLLAKYAYQYNFYKDPNTSYGPQGLENRFTQQEYYFSGGYSYKISSLFSAAYSSDYIINTLRAKGQFARPFAQPDRQTAYNNISLDAKWRRLHVQANALHIFQTEKTEQGPAAADFSRWNPSVSLMLQPFSRNDLHLRFFYKNIYKTPTFNDVYYPYVGNTGLRPEHAQQYNAGIIWTKDSLVDDISLLSSLDLYISDVKDKIVTVPGQNLFRWTTLNFGRVVAKGIDISLEAKKQYNNNGSVSLKIGYGFQQAREADKNAPFYMQQIPYTPQHSGSVQLRGHVKRFDAAINAVLSSYRYKLGEINPDNLVKEWATIDLYAAYHFTIDRYKTRVFAELNNILNTQYHIVKFYPMPRFNYRVGMNINF